jgi:hypothetical protein
MGPIRLLYADRRGFDFPVNQKGSFLHEVFIPQVFDLREPVEGRRHRGGCRPISGLYGFGACAGRDGQECTPGTPEGSECQEKGGDREGEIDQGSFLTGRVSSFLPGRVFVMDFDAFVPRYLLH